MNPGEENKVLSQADIDAMLGNVPGGTALDEPVGGAPVAVAEAPPAVVQINAPPPSPAPAPEPAVAADAQVGLPLYPDPLAIPGEVAPQPPSPPVAAPAPAPQAVAQPTPPAPAPAQAGAGPKKGLLGGLFGRRNKKDSAETPGAPPAPAAAPAQTATSPHATAPAVAVAASAPAPELVDDALDYESAGPSRGRHRPTVAESDEDVLDRNDTAAAAEDGVVIAGEAESALDGGDMLTGGEPAEAAGGGLDFGGGPKDEVEDLMSVFTEFDGIDEATRKLMERVPDVAAVDLVKELHELVDLLGIELNGNKSEKQSLKEAA